jgi:hypothetical protein
MESPGECDILKPVNDHVSDLEMHQSRLKTTVLPDSLMAASQET